jgi:hypothetical protein
LHLEKDGIQATILDEGDELSRGNFRRKELLVLKINWDVQVPRGIMKLGKVKKTYTWHCQKLKGHPFTKNCSFETSKQLIFRKW